MPAAWRVFLRLSYALLLPSENIGRSRVNSKHIVKKKAMSWVHSRGLSFHWEGRSCKDLDNEGHVQRKSKNQAHRTKWKLDTIYWRNRMEHWESLAPLTYLPCHHHLTYPAQPPPSTQPCPITLPSPDCFTRPSLTSWPAQCVLIFSLCSHHPLILDTSLPCQTSFLLNTS